jgi:hypothetical protein
MSGKTRALLLSFTIIAVIVFSAFGPATIAYADGDPTPEPPPAEATSPPEEVSTETTSDTAEVTPEATSVPEETAAPEVAPAESGGDESEPTPEATASETAEETAPVVEEAAPAAEEPVLAEVPENTTVTVLDENGESQPLATQEAADAIVESDPIWCPAAATAPTPGANGCTGSFSSFDELLTFLSGNPTYQGAGTIYVEQGAYQGNDPGGVIDFNAPTYDLSGIRNSALTVTGGWNPGTGAVDPANTSNFTNTRILIGSSTSRWGGSVTINNITMTFTNAGAEIPATPENGLTVYSQGDVALSNVSVSNAPSAGAEIDAGGSVTIENSKFHRNKTAGALVRATNSVNISNSEFQNPRVTMQRRQIVGLDINSGGEVSLLNVLANGNREIGTKIVAGSQVTIGSSVFSGMKELVGPRNNPTQFLGYGLYVETPAEINIDSVTANDNFLWGASLNGGGAIAVRNSVFNANTTESPGFIDDTGLFITGGNIVTLQNVTANDNRLYGTQIDAVGTVSISGSTFNNNRGTMNTAGGNTFHGHGMQITSDADIIINNTDASGNMLFGGELTAGGLVNIADSTFNNNSTGTDANAVGVGLKVISGGDTLLGNVVLDNNQTDGANIQAGGSVTLFNVTATNNGGNGVALQAACTHLMGGTFTGNALYGLNLGTSSLNLIMPPTFSGNGSGDMSPANPPTCSFVTTPLPAATTTSAPETVARVEANNVFVSLQIAPEQEASGVSVESQQASSSDETKSGKVSLTTYMGHARTMVGGVEIGIFHGKYAYTYSSAGMQIVAFAPSFDVLARD